MICVSSYAVQVPPALLLEPAENSESGQNPGRYRHCMRGGAAQDESQSLGFFLRRQCGRLMMRKSGDLLECSFCAFCVIMEWTVCLSWKNGHGSTMLPWLFCVHRRFADCRLHTAFDHLSVKRGNLCPGSHPPFGDRETKEKCCNDCWTGGTPMRRFAVLIPARESDAGKTGVSHWMTGQNPVYIFAMERGGVKE